CQTRLPRGATAATRGSSSRDAAPMPCCAGRPRLPLRRCCRRALRARPRRPPTGRRAIPLQGRGGRALSEYPPLLKLEAISKNFGAIEALKGVDMEIRNGEVVALLGDNGAGKSTLVKIISGGLRPSGGRIVMEGAPRDFA